MNEFEKIDEFLPLRDVVFQTLRNIFHEELYDTSPFNVGGSYCHHPFGHIIDCH